VATQWGGDINNKPMVGINLELGKAVSNFGATPDFEFGISFSPPAVSQLVLNNAEPVM
jgi:hypothetical protein